MKLKNMLKAVARAGILLLVITGCSSKVALLEPTGNKDQYQVLLLGDTGFTSLAGLQKKALDQAREHCKSLNRNYQLVNKRVQPTGYGVFPEVELIYNCKDEVENLSLEDKSEPTPASNLRQLKMMLDEGLITEEEYSAKKAKILDEF